MLQLTRTQRVGIMAASAIAFHVAHEWPVLGGAIVLFAIGIFLLSQGGTSRWTFYSGLLFGIVLVAPQLAFFWGIFKSAAVPLWFILALWISLSLLLSNQLCRRWPRWGVLAIPVIWTACEYVRSELYYLRFSWLAPGLTLSDPLWLPGVNAGHFGFALLVLTLCAGIQLAWQHRRRRVGAGLIIGAVGLAFLPNEPLEVDRVPIVGIQIEMPLEIQVMRALDAALEAHPEGRIFILGEYTFQGPVPEEVRAWCREHDRYLIAGGKEPIDDDGSWYNMAYVVGPQGTILFSQPKAVPIQFFNDGTPAPGQGLWHSPWGKIGIAICYDLSYTRVIDELVRQGAQGLIIPTLDAEEWGERQHLLHAKVAPVRAREYGLGIARVATSGVSQLVTPAGHVVDHQPFAAQNVTIAGDLILVERGRLPLDRYLAPACVAATALMLLGLGILRLREWRARG